MPILLCNLQEMEKSGFASNSFSGVLVFQVLFSIWMSFFGLLSMLHSAHRTRKFLEMCLLLLIKMLCSILVLYE